MSDEVTELLERAKDSLGAARTLQMAGYPGFAAARAYFTMFYIAQAFLETKGLAFSKHSATISAFGRYFVKSGLVPREYHRFLVEAQKIRLVEDYDKLRKITAEEAALHIQRAGEMLDFTKDCLEGE